LKNYSVSLRASQLCGAIKKAGWGKVSEVRGEQKLRVWSERGDATFGGVWAGGPRRGADRALASEGLKEGKLRGA